MTTFNEQDDKDEQDDKWTGGQNLTINQSINISLMASISSWHNRNWNNMNSINEQDDKWTKQKIYKVIITKFWQKTPSSCPSSTSKMFWQQDQDEQNARINQGNNLEKNWQNNESSSDDLRTKLNVQGNTSMGVFRS